MKGVRRLALLAALGAFPPLAQFSGNPLGTPKAGDPFVFTHQMQIQNGDGTVQLPVFFGKLKIEYFSASFLGPAETVCNLSVVGTWQ